MAWEKLTRSHQLVLYIGASVLLAAVTILAARAVDLKEPYLPFAIAGAIAFFARISPTRREWLGAITVSAACSAVMHYPARADWILTTTSGLTTIGWGALFVLGMRALWSAGEARKQIIALLGPALVLVFFVFSCQHALSLANELNPKTFDLYLFAFDGSLGLQPSFLAGQLLAKLPVLRVAAQITYLSLPFAMAIVYAWYMPERTIRPSWRLLESFLLAGLGGWLLYNFVPATGPVFVFREFPWRALPYESLDRLLLEKIAVPADVPRNAVPSLHMAWVLLLWWNSRNLPRFGRLLLFMYCALTVLATLGTGEHYFVDLVVSVPYALMIHTAVYPGVPLGNTNRATALLVSAGLTGVWLFLIRIAVPLMLVSRAIPWCVMIASLVGTFLLERTLRRVRALPQKETEHKLRMESAALPEVS